jgi:hypothetical protein
MVQLVSMSSMCFTGDVAASALLLYVNSVSIYLHVSDTTTVPPALDQKQKQLKQDTSLLITTLLYPAHGTHLFAHFWPTSHYI